MNGGYVVADKPRLSKDEAAALIARMRAYDSEMVTGIFQNLEAPGQGLRFNIHLYEGDDYDTYELFDGERYRIPRGVARHLENGCAYKQYTPLSSNLGVQGAPVEGAIGISDGRYAGGNNMMRATAKIHRTSFKSLEFSNDHIDSFQSSLFLPQADQILPKIM
jgi:hypothetical protein